MIIDVYLDDILIFNKTISQLEEFQLILKARFCVINLQELQHHRSITIHIHLNKAEIPLKQTKCLKKNLIEIQYVESLPSFYTYEITSAKLTFSILGSR